MSELESAPSEPIFTLELGVNGGTFAPKSATEFQKWIEIEYQFWSWLATVQTGNHVVGIHGLVNQLAQALNHATQAMHEESTQPEEFIRNVALAKSYLTTVFLANGLPHSSTALAKRVENMRVEDVPAAFSYLFVMLPSQGYNFEPYSISTWSGFIEGISEKIGLPNSSKKSFETLKQSTKELLAKSDQHISHQTVKIDELHRNYEEIRDKIALEHNTQNEDFVELTRFVQTAHSEMQVSHANLLNEHQIALTNLQKTFKENMALRSPVEYWDNRKIHHETQARFTGKIAFGSLAALAIALVLAAFWVLENLGPTGKPEAWRISFLAVLAVLGIWGVRLAVRIFLSHIHLGTDAAERVTMVKTYLSLLEGANLPNDDDRKLILSALFRPATDGLVKDEGLPSTFLEMLTRPGK